MNRMFIFVFLALSLTASAARAAPKGLALVYKGPTICDGCDDATADLARRHGYDVQLVKAGETTPELLARAAIYIVPGGEDVTDLSQGWTAAERDAIRNFVGLGGRYLGFCLGAYWAGDWRGPTPGFESLGIVPAHVLAHSRTIEDRVEKILWKGQPRFAYFQDGPSFVMGGPDSAQVFARYASDNSVASFVSRYFRGKVAVSGVHVEAPASWYTDAHLTDPDGHTLELADELFDALMAP